MNLILGVVMAVGLIGMIWCVKNQKKNQNAQGLAVICMIVVVLSAIGFIGTTLNWFGDPELEAITENSRRFEASKSEIVGKFLAKNFAGKKVGFFVTKSMMENKLLSNSMEILKNHLNPGEVIIVEFDDGIPGLPPSENEQDPAAMAAMDPMMAMSPERINPELEKLRQCDLIVNYVGFSADPTDNAASVFWTWKGAPETQVMIMREEAISPSVTWGLENNKVAGVLANTPTLTFDFTKDTVPLDPNEAFKIRYVIITPENLQEIKSSNPAIFIPE